MYTCVCECEPYIECNVLYAMSENCAWTRLGARCTYDTDISYLTDVFCQGWCTRRSSLSARDATVCWILRQNQFVSLFVLNWQFLFNMFRVQTYCLYKLLWLCIAYWMGRVSWIIKVVHFLYRRMFPLGFLYVCTMNTWAQSLFILNLTGPCYVFFCVCRDSKLVQ